MVNMLHETIREAFPDLKECSARELPVLTLAYIGDTIYDLYIRTFLIQQTEGHVHKLHTRAAKLVCAAGQAASFHLIEPLLTEEELSVYRRGRNSHSAAVPKNARVSDYRTATGFEALIGYLYWTGADERLTVLIRTILEGEI